MLQFKKIEERHPLNMRLKLEGEAYLGSVKRPKPGETIAESMRYSILSRARLVINIEGEDHKLVEEDYKVLVDDFSL